MSSYLPTIDPLVHLETIHPWTSNTQQATTYVQMALWAVEEQIKFGYGKKLKGEIKFPFFLPDKGALRVNFRVKQYHD